LAKGLSAIANCKKMVAKNNLSVNVVGCPIHRESNNLAMSSRNERLAPEERAEAAHLQTLAEAKKNLQPTISAVSEWVQNVSRQSSFYFRIFTIADEETLLSSSRKIKIKNIAL
jgi:pantoate--beta-alanine ligase